MSSPHHISSPPTGLITAMNLGIFYSGGSPYAAKLASTLHLSIFASQMLEIQAPVSTTDSVTFFKF